MIELVLSVCLIQQPDHCRDVKLTMIADNPTPSQCMTFGQMEAAKWSSQHPGWQLKRFKCVPAGHLAKA